MNEPAHQIIKTAIRFEHDVVLARQRARQVAGLLGFDAQDQTRIATAVSEIARNAFEYAGGGTAEFKLSSNGTVLQIVVSDSGPGFKDLDAIMAGTYRSTTGMGLGITGARRLMDNLTIHRRSSGGSEVLLEKRIPTRKIASIPAELNRISTELNKKAPGSPVEEMQQQNQELLQALADLRSRQEELERLNGELDETNRGVVALYAELEDRTDILRRTNEVKSTFLSNMTHEFRTPLNSILSLSRMLLGDPDEPLSPEQEKQVTYILRQAQNLSEMVNDLLDMAKVEAGKVVIKPGVFSVSSLFSTLRGMLRPLLVSANVNLIFDVNDEEIYLDTDEGKVSQILRNFISNALKYTEKGEVVVRATQAPGDVVVFSVTDTGVGIAPGDLDRIFEEYVQVANPLQNRTPGTGLGLPLARRLAEMLGGQVTVESEIGHGSTFYAKLPSRFMGDREVSFAPEIARDIEPGKLPVLIVEDNRETLYVYEKFLKGSEFQVLAAQTVRDARLLLKQVRPIAILMDVMLQNESTWVLLSDLKRNPATRDIPIYVVTIVENRKKAMELGADGYCEKPVPKSWLLETLQTASKSGSREKLLIIDDDEICRYLLRGALAGTPFEIAEAESGEQGIQCARTERPRAIFLDLTMPGMSGFETLKNLKGDPETRSIPVIINTAQPLTDAERENLMLEAQGVLSKSSSSKEDAENEVRQALNRAGVLATESRD